MLEKVHAFVERNFANISAGLVIFGAMFAFAMPYLIPLLPYYGLTSPNEIGDAFGGLANPMIGFIGVCLTFLAFFIQFKSNERQNYELEVQKKENAYRFLRESITGLKDDIKALRYTKERVVYHYSEAIWNFMMDNMLRTEDMKGKEKVLNPLFYQISYILTLFEPIIADIDSANLEKKEKYQLLVNLEGLFEASFEFVLVVQAQMIKEGKEKSIREFVKHKIIIPSKKIKNELHEVLERYKESEKEQFARAVTKIKGSNYVKSSRFTNGKGNIQFYGSFEEYKENYPNSTLNEQTYNDYFANDDNVSKLFINESVRLLMKLEFMNRITFQVQVNEKTYTMVLDRPIAEEYFGIDLIELKIDKDLWRDEFVGKYVYSQKERNKFMERFVKVT